ncbi:permease-like cell division protein FtsX [Halioxenophilus sp. WMMB6]|uniref:permease-like cell division protein FtsX n=1 Tax=Halioxenophilus sp. WMMB6 TaxID=3073815 RepID=UPI00295ECB30|nr:permease-like cell division protein FtsX [Halioxenophilus sp. WMMB6]
MAEGNRRRQGKPVRREAPRPAAKPEPRPAKKAVRRVEITVVERLAAYFRHHHTSAQEAFLRLVQSPGQSLPTCLVIAIALALPAMLYLGLINLESQANRWQAPAQLSVFLHKRASNTAITALREQLATRTDIESTRFITADQALKEFERVSGFSDVLNSLESNPLPAVLVITPANLSVEALAKMQTELSALTIVDSVQLDLEWVARLQQITALVGRIVGALALLLAVGVILIVGNVIRLAIANRKDEIVIAKLVGASNGFVRRPFLYTGLWYGCFGGILALLMLAAAQLWLAGPIARLAQLYNSEFELAGLGFAGSFNLVLAAAVLGSMGAVLSVSRHLAAIKPS